MIAQEIVLANESCDSRLQVVRKFIGDLVYVLLQHLVVRIQLPVGLRVEGRCQDVLDTDHLQ